MPQANQKSGRRQAGRQLRAEQALCVNPCRCRNCNDCSDVGFRLPACHHACLPDYLMRVELFFPGFPLSAGRVATGRRRFENIPSGCMQGGDHASRQEATLEYELGSVRTLLQCLTPVILCIMQGQRQWSCESRLARCASTALKVAIKQHFPRPSRSIKLLCFGALLTAIESRVAILGRPHVRPGDRQARHSRVLLPPSSREQHEIRKKKANTETSMRAGGRQTRLGVTPAGALSAECRMAWDRRVWSGVEAPARGQHPRVGENRCST